MKRYCFDTSGISNPNETMPEDIHEWLWMWFCEFIKADQIAVNTEIYEELCRVQGMVGECIRENKAALLLEIENGDWDWEAYIQNVAAMQASQAEFISEYNGGSPKTVCLNDISIIALAKTLNVPLVSMEAKITDPGAKKRRIPNVCDLEGVRHMTFNEFLKAENAKK